MQDISNLMQKARTNLVDCVGAYKGLGRQLATAERDYKIALRKEILKLHVEDGVAWTACEGLAHGHEGKEWGECGVAMLRFRRDCLKSDYSCCYERILVDKLQIRLLEGEATAIRNGS